MHDSYLVCQLVKETILRRLEILSPILAFVFAPIKLQLILALQRLIVRNLPWDTTEADLGEAFVTWGPLTEV